MNTMDFWVVESKYFDKDYEIHSLHRSRVSAKSMAREIEEGFPFDRQGDGVRIRRGGIIDGGLVIKPKVFWMRKCKTRTLADIMDEKRAREAAEFEDSENEFASDDADYAIY